MGFFDLDVFFPAVQYLFLPSLSAVVRDSGGAPYVTGACFGL